jgi:hypothetical protein
MITSTSAVVKSGESIRCLIVVRFYSRYLARDASGCVRNAQVSSLSGSGVALRGYMPIDSYRYVVATTRVSVLYLGVADFTYCKAIPLRSIAA